MQRLTDDQASGRLLDEPDDEREPNEAPELAAAREDALSFADDLAVVAEALRAVVAGRAGAFELNEIRGTVDGFGCLRLEATLDWDLLLRAALAGDNSTLVALGFWANRMGVVAS